MYSLTLLAFLFKASNKRYLEFISAFDNKVAGRKRLDNVSKSKQKNNRTYESVGLFEVYLLVLRAMGNRIELVL